MWVNDTAPKINFTYFAATCPIIASVPEHRLSSHPDQVFIKYVCSDLRDDFDLGYLGHKKNVKFCVTSFWRMKTLIWSDITFLVDVWMHIRSLCNTRHNFFQCPLFGYVPRKTPGNYQVINDLSYPKGNFPLSMWQQIKQFLSSRSLCKFLMRMSMVLG